MTGLGLPPWLDRALLANLLAFCLSPLASELNQPKAAATGSAVRPARLRNHEVHRSLRHGHLCPGLALPGKRFYVNHDAKSVFLDT
jgi:hypothetical protein